MLTDYLTGSKNFWFLFLIILLRYVFLAIIAFSIYYIIKKNDWHFRKIQNRFPSVSDYTREILYSIVTAFIFTGIGLVIFVSPISKYTWVYYKISDYGLPYFVFSIFLMIIFHDTYFYWTHRWMHGKKVFKYVHRVHHLSTNPSPWAAMAFHPLESVIEGSAIAFMAILFPVHPLSIGIFLLIMMIYNVYGHLGYELYPKGFSKTRIGKWVNTSVNHNMHHQFFNGNYCLYFLFWDRMMGTLQKGYDETFEEVKSRTPKKEKTVSPEVAFK